MHAASALAFMKRHCKNRQCIILIWCPVSPIPPLLRDTGEDGTVAGIAGMELSAPPVFFRLNRWPHPMLSKLFFPFDSDTVARVFAGELLRRPGESAHCELLEPRSRTELVRPISGELGLGIADLVVDPLEASLHSDPELATSAWASRE